MARLAAVILAGGKGKRLGGVIKAGLVVGAARLLDRVSVALGDLPSPVLVAYGSVPLGQLALRAGQIPVPDLCSDYEGPLAGLAGAVDWCARMAEPAEYLLSVAVDTPFLPDDFASRMLAAIGPADAVVACHAGQEYPTNAIWRLRRLAALPDRIAAGSAPRSLRRLAARLGATTLDWPESAGGNPFANVNTPDELDMLGRRARDAADRRARSGQV